jgi:hypothetical protein
MSAQGTAIGSDFQESGAQRSEESAFGCGQGPRCSTKAESFCSVRRFFPERDFPFGCAYAALCLCGERFVS